MKHVFQRFLQPEVAVKKAARVLRAELDQKINVAAHWVERPTRRRAKHLKALHAKTAAQSSNFGAVLFDEVDHGVFSLELCRQLPIHRLKHLGQLRPKQLVHAAHAAFLGEGGVFKVVGHDAEIGGDVVADHF